MSDLIGLGLIGIFAVLFANLVFGIIKSIYNVIKQDDTEPAKKMLELMREQAKLKDEHPELFQNGQPLDNVAVKNVGSYSASNEKKFDIIDMNAKINNKKNSRIRKILLFLLGAFTALMFSGGVFLLWLFW